MAYDFLMVNYFLNTYDFLIKSLSKRPQICFQDQLSLNAGQKYCRMLQGEHSAIFSTFIKLLFVIKTFILSIFEWTVYTGFTVYYIYNHLPVFIISTSGIILSICFLEATSLLLLSGCFKQVLLYTIFTITYLFALFPPVG